MIQSKSGHCTYHPRTGTQISLMKKQAQRSVIILVWAGWQMSHGDTENIRRRITDYSYSWMFTWVIRRSFKNQELMILLFCVSSLRNDSCQLFPHVNICHWFQPLGVEPRVSHHLICACVRVCVASTSLIVSCYRDTLCQYAFLWKHLSFGGFEGSWQRRSHWSEKDTNVRIHISESSNQNKWVCVAECYVLRFEPLATIRCERCSFKRHDA